MNGYIEHKMTGSIYAVRNTWIAPAKDNEWFNYRIRVVGKTIQTFINDKLICEYAEPAEPYRAEGQDGPAARLGNVRAAGARSGQCREVSQHEGEDPSRRMPRRLRVSCRSPIAELDQLVTQASNDNIPLIDLGLAPPAADADDFWRRCATLRHHARQRLAAEVLADHQARGLVIVDQGQGTGRRAAQGGEGRGREGRVQRGWTATTSTKRSSRRACSHQGRGPGLEGFLGAGKDRQLRLRLRKRARSPGSVRPASAPRRAWCAAARWSRAPPWAC